MAKQGLSAGRDIARRRKQLLWNQAQLADAAGVGLTTVVQIEKDRAVRPNLRKLVEDALAAEEGRRGVTYLDHPSGSTRSTMKEGADDVPVAVLEELSINVRNIEIMFETGLTQLRRVRLELDNRLTRRKSS
jgi:transcriptional regulator with XRE-family HTH domain